MKYNLQFIPAAGLVLLMMWTLSCTPSRLAVSPIPPRVHALEGYASLRIAVSKEISRTKFSFVFSLPHRGHVTVSDFLGRTLYQILILPEKAYLVVPSKKIYWASLEEKIIEKFLGFPLTLEEAIRFLSGRWDRSSLPGSLKGWSFQRDEQGRVVSGQRGRLFFRIDEFVDDSSQVESLTYFHDHSRGRLKILQLRFNPEVRTGIFSADFVDRYSETTWEEIQKLLKNAD